MSPRNEQFNQQIRDERREQILFAALQVFARRGFTAAKISDIAAGAGLSHGLVYHYFSSKDEIFTELVKRALEGSNMVTAYAAQQPGSPWEQLRWLTETILSVTKGESAFYNLIVLQAVTSDAVPAAVKDLMATQSQIATRELTKLLIAGQKAGQVVKEDAHTLSAAYFAFVQGVILNRLISNDSGPKPSADIILRFLQA